MKINKLKIVTAIIVFLTCLFLIGVLFNVGYLSTLARVFVFPFFVYLYFLESDTKSKYFAGFLIAYSIAEISGVLRLYDPHLFFYFGTGAYVLSYISLLVYILERFDFKILIKRFKFYLIVLALFNGYIIFVLNQMILEDKSFEIYTLSFLLECAYNVCILLLLSFSLLNYLYHDSKRGLLLFLASVCIVFSEMVQVAYLFVTGEYLLNVTYSILLVVGFFLVYVYITSKIDKYYRMLF